MDNQMLPNVKHAFVGNILDQDLLAQIADEYEIDSIFHLAALLSTSAERDPALGHDVNVQGTVNMLELAAQGSQTRGEAVKFIYASSIATYGLPDLETKNAAEAVLEDAYLMPTTMYGCNKLYCEHLGRYYAESYRQLDADEPVRVDFRAVRFPGLLSAFTVPSGGTSDYGPEMIHTVASGQAYDCFVREDSMLPFMAMPDASKALVALWQAPRERLTRHVYNVTSFNLSAADFAEWTRSAFPDANVHFVPDAGRQAIVDSWPAALDDGQARTDWGWQADYDLTSTFEQYLFPHIRAVHLHN
jgi:nucleoside-diphosphate-sugar epimerase